jgi:hypothetical protein
VHAIVSHRKQTFINLTKKIPLLFVILRINYQLHSCKVSKLQSLTVSKCSNFKTFLFSLFLNFLFSISLRRSKTTTVNKLDEVLVSAIRVTTKPVPLAI